MSTANLVPITKVQLCTSLDEQKVSDASDEKECIERIINLHDEIFRTAQSLLPKVMRVGELLLVYGFHINGCVG